MKPIYVRSGSYSLIGSGTLMPFEDNDIIISFHLPMRDRSIYDIDVRFKFLEDGGEASRFELVNPLESMNPEDIGRVAEYDFTIYNSSKPNGVSNEKPIFLGNFEGLHLYMNFNVQGGSPATQKVLHYTFYTSYND